MLEASWSNGVDWFTLSASTHTVVDNVRKKCAARDLIGQDF